VDHRRDVGKMEHGWASARARARLESFLIRAPLACFRRRNIRFAPSGAESLCATWLADLLCSVSCGCLIFARSHPLFFFSGSKVCLIICSRQKFCSSPQVRALPAQVQDRGAVLQPGVPLPPLPQRGYGELVPLPLFPQRLVSCGFFYGVSRRVLSRFQSVNRFWLYYVCNFCYAPTT
jgi:hypothetical protein